MSLATPVCSPEPEVLLSHLTDTRNRYEIKYLVPTREVPGLRAALGEYVEADRHGDPEWGYSVYSVYWDSPTFIHFWEKVEGLKVRRKIRVRRYVGSDDVYLEVKQRVDRTQQKRRLRLSAADAREQLLSSSGMAAADPVLQEVWLLCQRHRLAPRCAIRYRRRAFLGRYEPTLRVNFDNRIQYRMTGFDLVTPFDAGRAVIDPRTTVMEVKFTGRVPLWLTKTIGRLGLPMVRMSKYCSAVDRAVYGGALT